LFNKLGINSIEDITKLEDYFTSIQDDINDIESILKSSDNNSISELRLLKNILFIKNVDSNNKNVKKFDFIPTNVAGLYNFDHLRTGKVLHFKTIHPAYNNVKNPKSILDTMSLITSKTLKYTDKNGNLQTMTYRDFVSLLYKINEFQALTVKKESSKELSNAFTKLFLDNLIIQADNNVLENLTRGDKTIEEAGEDMSIFASNILGKTLFETMLFNNPDFLKAASTRIDGTTKYVNKNLKFVKSTNNKEKLDLNENRFKLANILKDVKRSKDPNNKLWFNNVYFLVDVKKGFKLKPYVVIGITKDNETFNYLTRVETPDNPNEAQYKRLVIIGNLEGKSVFSQAYNYNLLILQNKVESNTSTIEEADVLSSAEDNVPFVQNTNNKTLKSLFSVEKAKKQLSFRKKPLEFVDKIPTTKDYVIGASNRGGKILLNEKALRDKYIEKAWSKNIPTLEDGSKITSLPENQFNSFEEYFTFVLLHEITHDILKIQEGETRGDYENRINAAALKELKESYILQLPNNNLTNITLVTPKRVESNENVGSTETVNSNQYYEGNIIPEPNTVFVFGSNPEGINGNPDKGTGGAALVAYNQFGVKQGEKMNNKLSESGNAYGLTTVTGPGKKLSMTPEQITEGVKKLYEVAIQNPDKQFKVAYRNTTDKSLNGYTGLEMIEMFNNAGQIPSNIVFSKEWFDTGKLNLNTVETPTNNNPKDFTNHSGGAYGGDTFWDLIGREFGVTNHRHYKDSGNANLSQQLRNKGVKAEILTKEQMDFARQKVKELLGIEYKDDLKGNLQVRNFYQVYNSDAVYAIAKIKDDNQTVSGGTNTAVQLGIKLNKPVYVWDINSEQWYQWNPNASDTEDSYKGGFEEYYELDSEGRITNNQTPKLTKNFAGVGSRDIENYNVQKDGKWQPREEYVGKEKEEKAKQAIRDVYENTIKTLTTEQVDNKDTYQYFGANYTIVLDENNKGIDIENYSKNSSETQTKFQERKQKLLNAYNNNPNVDPQSGKPFRNTSNQNNLTSTDTKNTKYELFPGVYANEGQKEAIDKINEFLQNNDKNNDLFLLKGRGGTGKTTIIKKALENFNKNEVVGATVADEARQVLQESIPGYKTVTIASLLGLVPDYDKKTGELFFRERNEEEEEKFLYSGKQDPIEKASIIIIDESSMIDEKTYNLLLKKKLKNAKIIFMGDNAQIPPINKDGNSKDSPVWSLIDSDNFSELTTRMRQGLESPIVPITDMYANNIENIQKGNDGEKDPLVTRFNDLNNDEGVEYISNKEKLVEMFVEDYKKSKDTKEVVIVAARNNVVDEYNDNIRKKLFNTEDAYVEGDYVRVNSPYVIDGSVALPNGLKGKVIEVKQENISDINFKTFKLVIEFDTIDQKGNKIKVLKNVQTISPKDKKDFKTILNKLAVKANSYPKGSNDYKNAWREFYDLKNNVVDLGYGYAITAHKVQGSTYNKTYVIENDIMSFPGGIEQVNRMMYTAVSRPKSKLIIYNPTQVVTKKPDLNNNTAVPPCI
jgi:nucleoside-triphosphatase THEP1